MNEFMTLPTFLSADELTPLVGAITTRLLAGMLDDSLRYD
jgi:hypothetical protein